VIDAPSRVHLMVAGPSRIDPTDAAAAASLGVSIVPDPQDNVPDGKPALWGRTTVSPRDRDLAEVKVAMQPGATVSGQIVFETTQGPPSDLRGLSIDILANGRSIQRAAVDDSGLFAIHGLAPGSYFVAPDQTPPGWFLKSATSLGRDLLSMPLITTAGENVADLVVTLTDRPTEILGTVSDARYYPIASASVIAFPAEPASPGSPARSPLRVRSVRTSAAGVFHLVGLPLGDYLLVAIDDAAANGWQDPARLDALRASAVHVSLHDSDPRHQDLQILTKR